MSAGRSGARRAQAGFTLIEVLAVVLLTGMVLGIALDFYTDLSNASIRATEHTRELRRATAILDRVAREMEGAVLVRKPPEQDPLSHPWIFLGEARDSQLGADHVKFVTRGHRPRSRDAHESDLATVAFLTREAEDGTLELLRWRSPQLPESQDLLDFPFPDDPDVTLLADGLEDFGMMFMGEDGEWTETWDSSQLLDSSELPLAVEIKVAIAAEGSDGFDDEGFDDELPFRSRIVALPMRPIDLQVLLDPFGGLPGGDGDEDGDGESNGEGGGSDDRPAQNLAMCVTHPGGLGNDILGNYFENHKYDLVDEHMRSALAGIRLADGGTALDMLKPQCR